MAHPLYGDGIHDDAPAIQELLDRRGSCVALPTPQRHYLIGKTLVLHSNQELRLDRWTEIRLAPKVNAPMLVNDDPDGGNRRIAVTGGIWNGANTDQAPNPQMVAGQEVIASGRVRRMAMPADWPTDPVLKRQITLDQLREDELPWHPDRYWGVLMRFINIDGFEMRGVTLKDPVTYGVQSAKLTNFTFADITFDFNEGNPAPNNMDGLHFDGGCRYGRITNLKGACYDDLLAFNAEDGTMDSPFMGPISDIAVDGIFAHRCHSCARFLSNGSPIHNITIRNVFGTFYRYAFGFTHYFPERPARGDFDGIALSDLYIAKDLQLPSDWNCCPDWGLVWGEGMGTMGTLKVSGLHRVEEHTPVPTFQFSRNFQIESLLVQDCVTENHLEQPVTFIHNEGAIGTLTLRNNRIRQRPGKPQDTPLDNSGTIGKILEE